MTTLRDILRDYGQEAKAMYDVAEADGESKEEIERMEEDLLETFIEIITKRLIG